MNELMVAAAAAILVAAAGFDLRQRRIPNLLVLALAALGLARLGWGLAGGAPVTPGADLAVAGAVFAAGALAFHLGVFGGGDVKLMAAGALWLGSGATAPFLVVTSLAGGVLALVFLTAGALAGDARSRTPALPYGVAISTGALVAMAAFG